MSSIATLLRPMLHVGATVWLGVMAGFFWAYSANVSLATAQMDGPMYATVQSLLNVNVRHSMFFVFFFGPPLWVAAVLWAGWRERRHAGWWLLFAAGVLYVLGIIFFTQQVNLPNNAYTESWKPQALPSDWMATRDQWRFANLWRTVASGTCFVLACVALAVWPARARVERPADEAAAGKPAALSARGMR